MGDRSGADAIPEGKIISAVDRAVGENALENSGQLYVSTESIKQRDFKDIILKVKGKVNIISGRHGNIFDTAKLEPKFYQEDIESFGEMDNVDVFNYSELPMDDIISMANSEATTILAWCYSECFKPLKKHFK
ncbi:MAG: hypothetical protein K2J90_00635 [Lachnospiraceae bacterium]|nr:hypothetical protein [Lachnospiraceae bacterium]